MPVVNLYAGLRQAAGQRQVQVQGGTVRAALADLCAQHPALLERLFAGAEIRPLVVISLNGQHIDHLDGLETPAGEEDQIAVFPPVAGG